MYGLGFDKDMVKSKRMKKGYKAVTKDRRFKKEQEIYEHRLGQYAFKSKEANAATDQSIDKMKKVLVTYYQDKYAKIKNEEERTAKIFTDAFTTTREKNSAGQVGNVSYSELSKIINEHTPGKSEMEKSIDNETGLGDAANLREKMTALCNAAYMNNTRDTFKSENPATTFKRIVWDIAKQKNYEKAKALQKSLGLDESTLDERALESRSARKRGIEIKHRHRWITALYNTGLGGLVKKISGSLFPKDPYDVGIAAFNSGEVMQYKRKRDRFNIFKRLKYRRQHGRGQLMANIKSVTGLVNRDKIKDQGTIKSQEKMRRGLDYYDNMGLNLSNRERLYISKIVGEEYIEKHHSPLQQKGESDNDFNIRKRKHILQQLFLMSKAIENPDFEERIFTSEMKNELDKLMGGEGSEESKKFYEEAMTPGVETRKHALKYIFFMDKVLEKLKMDNQNKLSEEMETELDKLMGGKGSEESKEFYEESKDPKSSIKEGIVWKQHKSKGFLANMEKKHSVRIVNGISGTTIRMMKTAKWLGLKNKDLMNFRLALMGWMLPTDDHSLWEIIIGSHNVGVKGKEDMTDIPSLDMTVGPLGKSTLKQEVCSRKIEGDPMFPHEIVIYEQRMPSIKNVSKDDYKASTLAIDSGDIHGKSTDMFTSKKQLDEYEKNKDDLKKLLQNNSISGIESRRKEIRTLKEDLVDMEENPERRKYWIKEALEEILKEEVKIAFFNNLGMDLNEDLEEELEEILNKALENTLKEGLENALNKDLEQFLNKALGEDVEKALKEAIETGLKEKIEKISEEYNEKLKPENIEADYNTEIMGLQRDIKKMEKDLKEARMLVEKDKNRKALLDKYDKLISKKEDLKKAKTNSAQKMAVLNYTNSVYEPLNIVAFISSLPRFLRRLAYRSLRDKLVGNYKRTQYDRIGYSKLNPEYKDEIAGMNKEDLKNEYKTALQEKPKNKDKIDAIKKEFSDRRKFGKTTEYKQFINDLQVDNNFLLDTLVNVKNKYKGTVYRGTWGIKGLPPKGITKFKTFTSTSKNPKKALEFVGGLDGLSGIRKVIGNNVLMKIKLNGLNGVDLTTPYAKEKKYYNRKAKIDKYAMSVFDNEESEVLCPPGTKVRVKKVIKNVNLTEYADDAKKAKNNQADPTVDLEDNAVTPKILNNRKDRKLAEEDDAKIGNLVIAEEVK